MNKAASGPAKPGPGFPPSHMKFSSKNMGSVKAGRKISQSPRIGSFQWLTQAATCTEHVGNDISDCKVEMKVYSSPGPIFTIDPEEDG